MVEVNGGAEIFTLSNMSIGHLIQRVSSVRIKGYTQLLRMGNNGD